MCDLVGCDHSVFKCSRCQKKAQGGFVGSKALGYRLCSDCSWEHESKLESLKRVKTVKGGLVVKLPK